MLYTTFTLWASGFHIVGRSSPLEAKTDPFPLKGIGPIMCVLTAPLKSQCLETPEGFSAYL